jgi:uncharacterized protein (DUF1330 family)
VGNWQKDMIHVIQFIYIIPGKEDIFDQFEAIAIPIIAKYNGRLLLRVRLGENSFIEHHMDKPYEIHFVEFDTLHNFENFLQDEERKKILHLKEQSIKASVMVQGKKI